ncbi:MAG TPA: TPM domain-containing protein [Rhodanobacter sp.]
MTRVLIMLCWLMAVAFGPAHAADPLVPVPPLQALITDQTATLTAEQRAGLEARLRAFEDRKGSQLAVLIVATTRPETIEQYALRVAEQWKLGRKKVDDGALMLVAKDDRAVRIEVGYGLEGVLNDLTSNRIITEFMLPRFRQGDYFGGIDSGIDRIIRLVDGEALPAATAPGQDLQSDLGRLAPVLLVIAVVIGGVLRSALGRLPGAALTAGAVGLIAWFVSSAIAVAAVGALIAFMVTLLGGGAGLHGGGYGGHRGGGFGGGGFRGGGGGGFGGGGSSGRW